MAENLWSHRARGSGRGQMMQPGMGRGGRGGPGMHPGMARGGGRGGGGSSMYTGMGRGGRGGPGMHPGMGRGGRGGPAMHPGMGRGGRSAPAMYSGMGQSGRGRGGRMMHPGMGRGGRGGRMMRGWGRGRGRGSGKIPSKLDAFNRYVGYVITGFMEREDQENLGFAFPQFTPAPLTPEQQKMLLLKKQQEAMLERREKSKELQNEAGDNAKIVEEKEEMEEADDSNFLGALGGMTIKDSEEDAEITPDIVAGEKDTPDVTAIDTDDSTSEEDSTEAEKVETSVSEEDVEHCLHATNPVEGKTCSNSGDEPKNGCKLNIDHLDDDVTIPAPDPLCTCEPCIKALEKTAGKETCKCSACRIKSIQTIRECFCDRCRAMALKLADAPDLMMGGCKCDECTKNQMQPEKMKEMLIEREKKIRMNFSDCDTLLAALNTKRLYRRIKYFKRKDPEFDVDKAYPYGKNTEEIADLEWDALIDAYKKRITEKMKEEQTKEKEEAERKAKNKAKRMRKYKKNKKGKSKKKSQAQHETNDGAAGDDNVPELREEGKGEDEENPADNTPDCDDLDDSYDEEDDSTEQSEEDETVLDKYEYVADKPSTCELLMFTPCPRAVAVLASYPRSGNSLMRNLYEKIVLRVTGSDMMGGLQEHDLVGEMATSTKKCQFVKTHYPERMGGSPFPANRAVLLVRNPYDAMDSYFNLMTTSTHTTSLSEEERQKFQPIFAEMAKREVLVWRDFHEYWLKQKIPLLVVRYEDLIRDTVRVMRRVIKFVLEINSMTFFEDRIQRAIGEEQVEKLGPYKARSGGIGRSLTKGHYTPLLLHQINHGIIGTMEKFGYKEMLVPNPKSWKLRPIDQWGVYIPAKSKESLIVNHDGLVRGPNRQTNWRVVKMHIEKSRQEEKEKKEAETKNSNEEQKLDLL
eukprot:CAMPEP_0172409296 /NCGR_PEP_ID=MMETSP1061-20121228/76294_1 /TAXON_ID=37318 /ORGANISM="Pseudo-nitzschia pungens, Strain cf. pungens" /LENGTH=914 /DNA_ID=CAMNT_0013145449 /DNA_START=290 /DNA_END=3034 /DNA_ORIENTATION=-